jgi:hypothetical protein
MGALSALVVSSVTWATRTTTSQSRNANLWSHMQDATTQLVRDVNDASAITVATPNAMTALVVRDDKCQERAWVADPATMRLSVTTTFFEQAECTGPSSSSATRFIGNNAVGTNDAGTNPTRLLANPDGKTFRFYAQGTNTELVGTLNPDRVRRVEWTLLAEADEGYRDQTLTSGAAFIGHGAVASGNGQIAVSVAPTLCLSLRTGTGKCTPVVAPNIGPPAAVLTATMVEGVDAPVLQWIDNSTTKALSWTVYRIANADGAPTTTWTQVGFIPDPARTWWADTPGYSNDPLKAGYSAQYIVRATTAAGVGPTSTQVKTGLRPATSAVRATGAPTTIAVAWDKVIGATGYDVYRDGKLAKRIIKGDPLAWIDVLDFGHSHLYQVVATNAWEDHLTSGLDFGATIDEDTNRLATGVDVAATYTGATRIVTPATDLAAGAFTAPAAPTGLTANANADWSNAVTRTLAPWTGTGPTVKAGVSRDRGWEVQTHLTSASWGDLWTAAGEVPGTTAAKAHTGRPAGTWSFYQARGCNAIGCGPYSSEAKTLQRPATPSCTASGATTRSMVVTVNPVAMTDSAYTAYDVDGGTGAPTNTDATASNARTVDQLTHSTTQTFTGAAQNASAANGGWSDRSTPCVADTAVLGVAITGMSSTTRTINASMSTTNGSSSSLTLEGVRTDTNVGSASWDPLPDGTGYTVTARNSDGWNDVAAQTAVATKTLGAPAAPVCSASVTNATAPGSISIGGGDQVKLGSGGGVYGPRAYSGLDAGTYTGYSRNVASDGYAPNDKYSGWDACPTKTILGPPATPSSGFDFTQQRYCAPAMGFSTRALWSAVAGATSYDVRMHYNTTTSTTPWDTHTVTGTVTNWETYDTTMIFGSGQVQVRANNAAGSSAWSTTVTAAVTGGCQAG